MAVRTLLARARDRRIGGLLPRRGPAERGAEALAREAAETEENFEETTLTVLVLCGEGSSIAKFSAALRKEAKNADLDSGGAKNDNQCEAAHGQEQQTCDADVDCIYTVRQRGHVALGISGGVVRERRLGGPVFLIQDPSI